MRINWMGRSAAAVALVTCAACADNGITGAAGEGRSARVGATIGGGFNATATSGEGASVQSDTTITQRGAYIGAGY